MSGESTSASFTHTIGSDSTYLLAWCPCGLYHTVDITHAAGGMTIIDCACGLAAAVEHGDSPMLE